MMRHSFVSIAWLVMAFAAGCRCTNSDHAYPVHKLAWSSLDAVVYNITLLDHGACKGSPVVVYVVYPEGDEQAEARIRETLTLRGYEVMHDCPDMVSEFGRWRMKVALADPVGVLEVLSNQMHDVATALWLSGVPYGVELGNWVTVFVPRRMVSVVRQSLQPLVPSGAWKDF